MNGTSMSLKKPSVKALLGRCVASLKLAGQHEAAKELQEKAMTARSYDETLQRMLQYVQAY
jgi:hypothetical protein